MITDAYCSPDDLDTAISTYNRLGFVVLRGAVPDEDLDLIEAELTAAQDKLIEGTLDSRYGTELLDEPGATFEGEAFRHYVINCTCLLYTSPSPRDPSISRMPSSA